MQLVVGASVVMSAPIARPKTRELIVTLEPPLLTPAVIHDGLESPMDRIIETSGMEPSRVQKFIESLFGYIKTVPVGEFYEHIDDAERAIGETDPDDVLYLACALGCDAGIWRTDSNFDEQNLVPVFTTSRVIDSFETV